MTAIPGWYSTSNLVRIAVLISGLGPLPLTLCPGGAGAQQKQSAPTCDVRLDLQYEVQKTARVTLAGQMEVAPEVVQVVMSKAGEMHWDELTKHGRKYPGICLDDEHPYYVLVWEVTDYDATTWLYVLDNGCLVEPHVFGSNWISRNREKAIKKVFEDTLRFLVEKGKQPAPSPSLGCRPPELLGPLGPTKYKLKAEIKTGYVKCQTGASKVSVWLAVGDLTEVASPTCGEKVDVLRGGGAAWMKVRTQDGTAGYIPRAAVADSPDLAPKAQPVAPTPASAPQSIVGPSAPPTAPTQRSEEGTIVVGTGFFVSEQGYILTNAHVISGCKQIQAKGRPASLVSDDEKIDLALLRMDGESPAIARFRLRPPPRIGDSVVAFGFPLQGILSSGGNLTTGTISAETGIGDDPRFVQISAPVQPGSSGSPLLDSSGDVVGIVEAKLDAVETLRVAGDIPQNVNFAIRASEAVKFLERNSLAYHADATGTVPDRKVADIAAKAKQFSVPIVCLQ